MHLRNDVWSRPLHMPHALGLLHCLFAVISFVVGGSVTLSICDDEGVSTSSCCWAWFSMAVTSNAVVTGCPDSVDWVWGCVERSLTGSCGSSFGWSCV